MYKMNEVLNKDLYKPLVYHTDSKSAAWDETPDRRVFYQLIRHIVNS